MPTSYKIDGVDLEDLYIYRSVFSQGNLWIIGDTTGDNTLNSRSSPVQTAAGGTNWKRVAVGGNFKSAIKTDGTLWTWGYYTDNQLGDNTYTQRSSPVQTAAGGTDWKFVALGNSYATAIKTDGSFWVWGNNDNGQFGDGTTTGKAVPTQVGTDKNWKQTSCGTSLWSFTAAIKTDGTLWMFGNNDVGQLGDNSTTGKSSPVQTVAGGTNWKQVACGLKFTTAIKTDGTLWLWGNNGYGEIGDNSITHKSSPVQTVAGGTNWKQVSVLRGSVGAIKTDGTLWTWGENNNYGHLGNDTRDSKSSPIQTVAGGTNWKQIAVGEYFMAGLKTDGTIWTWGRNDQGQLGDNSTTSKSSPIQTIAGGTSWKQIYCGNASLAMVSDIF